MPTLVYTAPSSEPITLAEAKAHLRLEHGDDDAYVTSAITAARTWAEEYLWRGIVTQTWELYLDAFPCGALELPGGNLGTLSHLKHYPYGNSTLTAVSASVYRTDAVAVPGQLHLVSGQSWPQTEPRWDAVQARYTVGWATASVPGPIKAAIKLLVSQLYEQRTPTVTGTIVSQVPRAVEALLDPYRLRAFR